ncbi:MAG: hydrogenase subunit MbhD domain-containing protein [Candidatus Cryosericum sp.]
MTYFAWFLIVLTLVLAVLSVHLKDLLAAVILMGASSLIVSVLFLFLQAPDVAMSEASIGAALTMAIYIIVVKKTEASEK